MRKLKESIVHPPFKSAKPIRFTRLQDFDVRKFPVISQAINIDKDLRVKFRINGIPVPLLKYFVEGCSTKLVKFSILDYFPIYLSNETEKYPLRIYE